jgi:transcription initiation factor IIE alpha subunit
MAIIKWEYGKWNSIMGYQCGQCGTYYPFTEAALKHEEAIDNNGGICPDAKEAPHE